MGSKDQTILSYSYEIINPICIVQFYDYLCIYCNMRVLITESQLDKLIFRYLDSQNFIQIETSSNIFFVNSEDDEHAQIRYNKKNGVGQITLNLIEEISVLFSLDEVRSKNIIGNWVGDTLQMEVSYAQWVIFSKSEVLRVHFN
jgi:hypothetical protein